MCQTKRKEEKLFLANTEGKSEVWITSKKSLLWVALMPISSKSWKPWAWHWHKVQEAQKLKGDENLWNPIRKADSTWQHQFNDTQRVVWWSMGKRDFSSVGKMLEFYLTALTEWFSWSWPGKMVRLQRSKGTLDAKPGTGLSASDGHDMCLSNHRAVCKGTDSSYFLGFQRLWHSMSTRGSCRTTFSLPKSDFHGCIQSCKTFSKLNN